MVSRKLSILLIDAACWFVAGLCAVLLWYPCGSNPIYPLHTITFTVMAATIHFCGGLMISSLGYSYRMGTIEDVVSLALRLPFVVLFSAVLVWLLPMIAVPEIEVIFFVPLLAGLWMLIIRIGYRVYKYRQHKITGGERVFVVGAGGVGYAVVKQLQAENDCPYIVVGAIDDDPDKKNTHLAHNVRVLGNRHDVPELCEKYQVRSLIFAIHDSDREIFHDYVAICESAGLKVLVLPTTADMFSEKFDSTQIREIKIEDLLGRRHVNTNIEQVAGYITGKRVLITGAGGSIGSELCRQVHKLHPAELIMLDRDENSLHAIQLDIYGQALLDSPDIVLCDIRDIDALRRIFETHHPEVIFHSAALKHLPMLELYPEEGWKTNTLGTHNLLQLAAEYGVERFVNISTDKAADPTSTLGRTKRLAERLTSYFGHHTGRNYVSVRFGNVLGSRGSVLWTFRHQIEKGGPITVTHPDVNRYFMTIPEACELVIQAGAIGRIGEVMVLDMGTPVKIYDMAKRMVEKSNKDIEIVITGLRPGEKLSEVLLSTSEVENRPFHPLISHVDVPPIDPSNINDEHEYATHGRDTSTSAADTANSTTSATFSQADHPGAVIAENQL